jgi:hypothetical protein
MGPHQKAPPPQDQVGCDGSVREKFMTEDFFHLCDLRHRLPHSLCEVLGRELLTRRAALGLVSFQTLRQEYLSRVRRFFDLETMPQEPTGGSRLV